MAPHDACAAPFKQDLRDYLDWMRHTAMQCAARGAKILMNTEATPELLNAEGYDALILAVGAEPLIPDIPGVDGGSAFWAPDAEAGRCPVGDSVVVIGGSSVGMEAGLDFDMQGKKVTVVEMLEEGPAFMRLREGSGTAAQELRRLFAERGIPVLYGHRVTEILANGVQCEILSTGEQVTIPCDTALLACGLRPRRAESESMRRCAPETDVYVVGDGAEPASIFEAVNNAFRACLHV